MFAIPLAWLQLKRERIRLLIALAGIGFAVILMFMQLGFQDALFESAVRLHKSLQGDIFLISPQSTALIAMRTFSQRRLFEALGYDGIESVSPMYLDFGLWKNPQNRRTRSILVIGIDPDDVVFDLPEVQRNLDRIKLPDIVLFDAASRDEFILDVDAKNPEIQSVQQWFDRGNTETEISNRRVTVGGLFHLGASFGADGNTITSDLNFLRIFNRRQLGLIDVGVITAKPDANVQTIVNQMRGVELRKPELRKCEYLKNIPDQSKVGFAKDVCVLTKAEFMEFERSYWSNSTAIGFIFTLGTAIGFLVGTVIVYQILYTDVSDHLAEYATLKAMGYKNSYLFSVVFQEAIILSVLGYIPGFALCLGLYQLTQNATSLPIAMTLQRSVTVFILTMLMCAISGAIAVRKVQSADPADIF